MITVSEFHETGRSEEQRNQVRQRRVDRLERRWWGRVFINLFIVWHLFALAAWLLPNSGALVQIGLNYTPVRAYMRATNFAQSWSMFSPYPDKMDLYLEAEITYKDGQRSLYPFPRLVHMGYARRYEEERWRKFIEVATHGNNQELWPALARYAARQAPGDSQNPAVSVRLIQHLRLIPSPGEPIPDYKATPMQAVSGAFVQPIHPEDLQ